MIRSNIRSNLKSNIASNIGMAGYGGPRIIRSMSDVVSTCVFDLDATNQNSYPGSGQVWKNLIPVPYDGSAQTAYDMDVGADSSATATDPAFTGTVGLPSAYWLLDGGDYFNLPANTAFINSLQRTDTPGPISGFLAFRYVADGVNTQTLFGTSNASTVVGWRLFINTTGRIQFSRRSDSAANNTTAGSGPLLVDGVDYVIGFSVDAAGTTMRFWCNEVVSTDLAITSSDCVTDSTLTLDIGASGTGTGRLSSGSRVYGCCFFKEHLTSAKAILIAKEYERRHARQYVTPINTVAPAVTGNVQIGSTLTTTDGTWTGPGSIAYTYQWRRDGVAIGSQTANTYVVTIADIGTAITCTVTGTNAAGGKAASSNSTSIPTTLLAAVSSVVFDLDATIAASYDGTSQTWSNLIAAPADSEVQTAYDMYLGNSSAVGVSDPTFRGIVGDISGHFELDGGDCFTLKSQINTALLKALHKTTGGSAWWVAIAFKIPVTTTTGVLLSTRTLSSTKGINMQVSSTGSGQIFMSQRGDGGANVSSAAVQLTAGTDYVVIYAYNGTDTIRRWINTVSKTDAAITFDTTADDPSGYFSIGSQADGGGSKLINGNHIKAVSMGNADLADASAANIFAMYELRHGEDYTP